MDLESAVVHGAQARGGPGAEEACQALLRGDSGHADWECPGKLGGGRECCNVLGAHKLDRPRTDGGGQGVGGVRACSFWRRRWAAQASVRMALLIYY